MNTVRYIFQYLQYVQYPTGSGFPTASRAALQWNEGKSDIELQERLLLYCILTLT